MRFAAVLAFLLGQVIGSHGATADCGTPERLADGWSVASPSAQGLDTTLICDIGQRLRELPGAAPNGVVIIRHGVLVHEQYFEGPDQRWPQRHWGQPLPVLPHDAATLHDPQSATKSVVSLLVGIALDRGMLPAVNAPVLEFFPDHADLRTADRNAITLRDVLTMRAGLRWIYRPYLAFSRRIDAAADPYRLILEQPVTAVPGAVFRYNNGNAELAGAILARATQRQLDAYAAEVLFAPLDIADWEWGRLANGAPSASWGLRLRPRDFAKLGQIVLDGGRWRGNQIVSQAWIAAMTAPHVTLRDRAYGYFWWRETATVDGRPVDIVVALGWGGQNLYVIPELDLVVASTAGVYNFDANGPQGLAAETARDLAVRAVRGR